ncbi:hypothetical protein MBLNU457_4449t2 [Dothideomycetes sp. NU457]
MASLITAFGLLAIVASVSADGSCCFHLNATGGPGGDVGQLSDGQNRIGQNLPEAQYCINNGALTDSSGRGCILTAPTTQFQCDVGAAPSSGFAIACNGTLDLNGNSIFSACPTEDNGGFNIYTSAPSGQQGCVPISLAADSCGSCPPPPPPLPPPPASSTTLPPPTVPTPSSCPVNLNGNFEYPHLMVPISASSPNTAYGTSYNGNITSDVSTIFNFDIPYSDQGKTCSLIFLFPTQAQLETSSFRISGPGTVDFALLEMPAGPMTTYNNAPAVQTDFGMLAVAPGNSYTVATFPCPAGTAVGVEMKSVGGTNLWWFQDYNPDPIGLYISVCQN